MSKDLDSLPSLPPKIQGKIHGNLSIHLGEINWISHTNHPQTLLFRIKFWGETSQGIILKSADYTVDETFKSSAQYNIKLPQANFINYLNDMSILVIDVLDSNWRLIGEIKINIKLYFRKDHEKLFSLEVDGLFPIIKKPKDDGEMLGELEVRIETQFGKSIIRESEDLLASFQLNELKSAIENATNKVSKLEYPEQEQNFKSERDHIKNKTSSIFVPKNSLKKIPKPEMNFTEKDELSLSTEWDKLKEKGEKLKAKLRKAKNYDDFVNIVEDPQFEGYETIESETVNLLLPEKARNNIHKTELVQIPERLYENTLPDLSSIKQLKLSVSTLNLLLEKQEFKDKSLFVEYGIPVPINLGSQKSSKKQENIHTDIFRISHKVCYKNIYQFNHESLHVLNLQEALTDKLASLFIYFKLFMHENKIKDVEMGYEEISWEKILLSPELKYSVILELVGEEKLKNGKSKSRVVGRLSVQFELILDGKKELEEKMSKKDIEESQFISQKVEPPKTSNDIQIPSPKFQRVATVENHTDIKEVKAFQLYLYIDKANTLTRQDGSNPNIFITYKTFPEPEKIITPVYWNYDDDSPIQHRILLPISSSESTISKLYAGILALEVWDKQDTSKDILLGLVKLPLNIFGTALSSGMETLSNSVYPFIAFDEFKSINNIRTGKDIGFLKVCLALGTPAQVHRLHLSQTSNDIKPLKDNSSDKRPSDIKETKYIDNKEPPKFIDWELENEKKLINDRIEIVSESVESIGDIASFLNHKTVDNKLKQSPIRNEFSMAQDLSFNLIQTKTENVEKAVNYIEKHDSKINQIIENIEVSFEETISADANKIKDKVFNKDEDVILVQNNSKEFHKASKNREELIESIKEALEAEKVSLEEEFKLIDRYGHGFMHSESLSHLLNELRIGISLSDIQALISHIIAENPTSSNLRRVLFTDVYRILQIFPETANIKHMFKVTIKELISCPLLTKITNKCAFLKYQFPNEEIMTESELLEQSNTNNLSLSSSHSFVYPYDSGLSDWFNQEEEGISIYLIKTLSRCEEYVLAKGLLPIEDLIEIETEKKINRVICLYGNKENNTHGFKHEIIGKVKLSIEYMQIVSYENTSSKPKPNLKMKKQLEITEQEIEKPKPPQSKFVNNQIIPTQNIQRINITIESAMHISKETNNEITNPFLQFKWFDSKSFKTSAVMRSSCPAWNITYMLDLPCERSLLKSPIVFELWHRSYNYSDAKIGECCIDFSSILTGDIDNWFHIMSDGRNQGQLHIKAIALSNVINNLDEKLDVKPHESTLLSLDTKNDIFKEKSVYEERVRLIERSLEQEDDDKIYQKHLENMRSLENLTQNFGNRLKGRDQSPLKIIKSPDKNSLFLSDPYLLKDAEVKHFITYRDSPSSFNFDYKESKMNTNLREIRYSPDSNYKSHSIDFSSMPQTSIDSQNSRPSLFSYQDQKPEIKDSMYQLDNFKILSNIHKEDHISSPLIADTLFTRPNPNSPHKNSPENHITIKNISLENSYNENASQFHMSDIWREKISCTSPKYSDKNQYVPIFTETSTAELSDKKHWLLDHAAPEIAEYKEPDMKANIYDFERNLEVYNEIIEIDVPKTLEPEVEESDEEWDPQKIAEVLNTIEEATKLESSYYQNSELIESEPNYSDFENYDNFTTKHNRDGSLDYQESYSNPAELFRYNLYIDRESLEMGPSQTHEKISSSDIPETYSKLHNPSRVSPGRAVKPPLPKNLLSDPEISRIAAIMKGSKY